MDQKDIIKKLLEMSKSKVIDSNTEHRSNYIHISNEYIEKLAKENKMSVEKMINKIKNNLK